MAFVIVTGILIGTAGFVAKADQTAVAPPQGYVEGVLARQLREAQFDDVRYVFGRPVSGPHRQHHRRAEVHGDARVDGQLTR